MIRWEWLREMTMTRLLTEDQWLDMDRAAQTTLPAAKALVCAVIERARDDALHGNADALAWFRSREFAHWCDYLGWSPDDKARQIESDYVARRCALEPAI